MQPADRPTDLNPPRASHSYGPPMAYEPGGDDPAAYAEPAGPPTQRINARLVWRAVRRHWWQSLFIWAVGSATLMVIAYYRIKPTYEAYTHIKVEQGDQKVFHENGATIDFNEYKETQVTGVTQPNVLVTALAEHPELLTLPRLAAAEDPEAEIRQALSVLIIPKTSLIRVSMASEFPNEAAQVVNAVTLAYVKTAMDANSSENELRLKRLREEYEKRKADVDVARAELVKLSTELAAGDKEVLKDRDKLTADSYASFSFQLTDVQIKRMAAQTHLQELENERPAAAAGRPNPADRAQRRVESMINRDPRVIALRERIDKARESAGKSAAAARGGNDPAVVQANGRAQALSAQLAKLREELRVEVAEELAAGDPAGGDASARRRGGPQRRPQAHQSGEVAHQLAPQARRREQELGLQPPEAGVRLLQPRHRRPGAGRDPLQPRPGRVRGQEPDGPAPPRVPGPGVEPADLEQPGQGHGPLADLPDGHDPRPAGPDGAAGVAGGDPDELPRRVHLNVLGVVPPLPQVHHPEAEGGSTATDSRRRGPRRRRPSRSGSSTSSSRAWTTSAWPSAPARTPGAGERRCILITSACGSEGKTTLAAQLAERCVNAGLMTLLIDGDLRNPTLSRMLDVPEGRGLINVLRGEADGRGGDVVVGGAGGFRFLPAGTPRVDPARLLHGERLGRLLTAGPREVRHRHRRRPAGAARARRPDHRPMDRRRRPGRPLRHQPVRAGREGEPAAGLGRRPGHRRRGQRRPGRRVDLRRRTTRPMLTPSDREPAPLDV